MHRLHFLTAFLLIFCLLSACKQGDSQQTPAPTSAPVAVVESQTVVVGSDPLASQDATTAEPVSAPTDAPTPEPTATPVPLSCAGVWKVSLDGLSMTLTIEPDGAFNLVQGTQSRQGQVREEGDTLLFVWETGSYACPFQLQEDTLLLSQNGYEDLIFEREAAE